LAAPAATSLAAPTPSDPTPPPLASPSSVTPATASPAADARPPDTAVLDGPEAEAAAWSDLGVANEDVPLGEATRVGVRDDPLGRWMVVLDDTLREHWTYPPRLRALGVEGTAILRFRVRRDGEIDRVVVVRSAGNIELDRAALAAVPARTTPLPREVRARSIEIRYTFRYRGGGTDLQNGATGNGM
jgi:TonB family protein